MTGTALDTYLPYDAGVGANVTESQWQTLADPWLPVGVVSGVGSELAVVQRAAGANMSVDVGTGEARIKGMQGVSTSVKNLGVSANGTGNPRVDLIVLRNDFLNNQVLVDILAGTAAVNPVEPALTQTTSMWEEPLAAIDVASGAVSIGTANIRDRRTFTRVHRQGIVKDTVRNATTAALAASTITGTKRVANANGALGAIDGITNSAGDRILDKDHATTAARGIWRVVDPGSASVPWRMERPYDADETADVRSAMRVLVSEGTAYKDSEWQLTTDDPITLGTTGLSFFPIHLQGTGTPEGAVPAPVGATFRRTDGSAGTTFYSKESGSGNTGWLPFTSAPSLGSLLDVKFNRKTADESVTSSTTLQNDDDISRAVAANEIWTFELTLFVVGDPAGDIKWAFTVPTGATLLWAPVGAGSISSTSASAEEIINSDAISGSGSIENSSTYATRIIKHIRGIVVNGANAGTIQFQWTQSSSSVTATTVQAQSHAKWERWA